MKDFEVVISGVSGTFPECLNLQELEQNIFTNENFVNDINPRWQTKDVPRHIGKIKKVVKFDDTFFGIHRKLTVVLDPHAKHSFEKTYEAICDAGRNPADFFNSNTAIVMASSVNETEGENMLESKHIGHLLLGYSRCMQSNRVSYAFNFKGPSMTLIGSWETGLAALEMGRSLIAKGHVKQAIVGATNMIFYPQISRHYQHLGKLNNDGKIKSFSADADGYSRSDSIVVFFLQRADDAFRSYGSIIKSFARTEMAEMGSIVQPLGFRQFLGEFYSDLPIKPSEVAYIQGDGSAALETDAMELEALSEVMCPGRNKPLPVTSCKSKLGHAEGASGLVSVVSALIAMKTGYIPPVLHFNRPNPLVPALKDGRIKIVTEKTPLDGDYVGVTSIGLLSAFGHALLKRNPRRKQTLDPSYFPQDGIPRLFFLSGRDEDQMNILLQRVVNSPIDDGFYSLNHKLFKKEFPKHLFRGFAVRTKEKNNSQIVPYPGGDKRPVWFIFSGMGSQWPEMGKAIMKIPLMRTSIEKSHKILESKGLDLISIINNPDAKIYDNILHCFVGIAAIQIALVDLLEALGVVPERMIGHSVGELGCSYADKCLTAEQVILAAYARGKASNDAKLVKGMMAAVGKGYNDMKRSLPEEIEIACHNSSTSCTLSGPAEPMKNFVDDLKSKGVFAKLVNVANIAYHSKNIAPAAPFLLKYLKEIIPEPKMRSNKWVSSSIPEMRWNTDLAHYCSAEYHTNNLLSHVLFEEASSHVPDNAICIEIAPHGLLQAIVKKSLPECTHISLTNRAKEGTSFLIEALALLFTSGVNMDLTPLYPKMEYPLPRETEYMHPYITWNHTEDWIPISLERDLENYRRNVNNKQVELFPLPEDFYDVSMNHCVSGSPVYFSTKLLSVMMDYMIEKSKGASFKCYEFQKLKFHEHLVLDNATFDKLNVLYQTASGKFEMAVGDRVLLDGHIRPLSSLPDTLVGPDMLASPSFKEQTYISEECLYQFFQEKECTFNNEFKNIIDIKIVDRAFVGRVKWCGSVEFYIDSMLKLMMFYESIKRDQLMEIESIDELIYDPTSLPSKHKDVYVYYNANIGHLAAEGVRMSLIKTRPTVPYQIIPEIEKRVFQAYSDIQTQVDFIEVCLQVALELSGSENINVVVNLNNMLYQQIISSKYFNTRLSAKGSVKLLNVKDMKTQNNLDSQGIFIFMCEGKLDQDLINLIDLSNQCSYVIQSNSLSDKSLSKFKRTTPILDRIIENRRMIFYKKTINLIMDANFIQVPDGCLLEKPDSMDELIATKKINFFLFKYNALSEISFVLESSKSYFETENARFVFTDSTAPLFDPTNDFYHNQLKKDTKINVCQRGQWGTIRDLSLTVPNLTHDDLCLRSTPLNKITCDNIDLKVVGLNLQNLVNPTINNKLEVLDYSGVGGGGREVMGVAKLTPDNRLELDPVLSWSKPPHWSMEQAASVPFLYSLAYYLLRVQRLPEVNPPSKVFIHGAHTPFSQAVINVVLGMKASVYTTCFTPLQKQQILKRFPKLDKSKVYVMDEGSKYMVDDIVETTNGEGVDLVLDSLEDDELRNCTMQCLGKNGKYFFFCHNDTNTNYNFGMSIFMRETAVMGLNPDMILDMKRHKKELLIKMVEEGIKNGEVVPLDSFLVEGDCTRKYAVATIVSSSRNQGETTKALLNIDKSTGQKPLQEANGMNGVKGERNNYMIIGSHNSLWYDMVNWLASKGADNIFVIMEWNMVPTHIQMRFKSLMRRHTTLNVRFLEMNHLSSLEKLEQTLQLFGETLDKVFYIMPGMEKGLEMVDTALRKLSRNSWLVCIGSSHGNAITDKRVQDGFKGVSLVLKKDTLRNRTIINVLDHWLKDSEEKHQLIFLDERDQDKAGDIDPDVLPSKTEELTELVVELSEKPEFKEMSSSSLPMRFSKELDPVFFFPGFRVSKMKHLISKFTYPSFLARYPSGMKCYEEVASSLTEELLKFDLRMFNLVAEGWAGPLALKVAHLLEKGGRISQIILLDGTPLTIKKWSKSLANSESNIISKSIASLTKGEDVTIEQLKAWRDKITAVMTRSEELSSRGEDVKQGLETLMERLEAFDRMGEFEVLQGSKIHIFTSRRDPLKNNKDITQLNEICKLKCSHHLVEDLTSDSILDSDSVLRDVRDLVLVEYKGSAVKQKLEIISTLEVKQLC